jgi:type II secretory pathway component GspD/PulD (secretin)
MRITLLVLVLVLGSAGAPLRAQLVPRQPQSVRIFTLKNADAEKLRPIITTIFGSQGVVAAADARTNSLVVTGDSGTLEEIRKLVEELDKPAKKK